MGRETVLTICRTKGVRVLQAGGAVEAEALAAEAAALAELAAAEAALAE